MAQILKLFFLIKIQTYGNSDWIGSLKSATLTKILTCGFKQAPKLNNTSTSINLFIQKFIHKFNLVYIFLFFFSQKANLLRMYGSYLELWKKYNKYFSTHLI